jgi:thymidylate kinase
MPGKLVVFSGLDGAGKSTQLNLLRRHLDTQGLPHVTFWSRGGYTPGMETAKALVRRVTGHRVLPPAGHSQARTQQLAKPWKRRLWLWMAILDLWVQYAIRFRLHVLRGRFVLADRYWHDTLLDFRLNFPRDRVETWWIWKCLVNSVPTPDHTFVLTIPVEESQRRSAQKKEPFPTPPQQLRSRAIQYEAWSQNGDRQAIGDRLDGSRDANCLADEIWAHLGQRATNDGGELPSLLILNQMAGPMTWELAVDLGSALGQVAMLTGHPDTLAKGSNQGVSLHRSVAYRRGTALERSWCWFRYAVHAFFWVWRFPATTPILAFTNPPVIPWVCWMLRVLRGTPYAIMVHDIYPDAAVRLGFASPRHPIVRLWQRLNRSAYQRSTAVLALGKHMAAYLEQQFDPALTRAKRIRIVPPWADGLRMACPKKEDNWFARKYRQVDCLTVMYSGNMGRGHDIETLLEVAERLRDDRRVHFMFIGAGPKWNTVKEFLIQRPSGHDNVTLLRWQDESVIPFSLATADVSVVSLEPELTGLAVPSKAYYFLAAGAPLLGLCHDDCELADTIQQFRCGHVVTPGDADALCATIQRLTEHPTILRDWQDGAKKASQHYSRKKNTQRFLSVLSEMKLVAIGNRHHRVRDIGKQWQSC